MRCWTRCARRRRIRSARGGGAGDRQGHRAGPAVRHRRPAIRLEAPDQLTDLASFADALLAHDFRAHPGVLRSAKALKDALVGIKVYGSPEEQPWVGGGHEHHLGLQRRRAGDEHLPARPLLRGLWDWRSPYYLDINPDPNKPRAAAHHRLREGHRLGGLHHRVPQGEPGTGAPAAGAHPAVPGVQRQLRPKQFPPRRPAGAAKPGQGGAA